MPDQRNIIGTGDHYKQIKNLFPGYLTKVNPGYTHKDLYFDNLNIDKFKLDIKPKMLGTTAYEVPAQAALDSLYSADYLKKYTPKVEEVNARRAKLNTHLAPISPYFNVLLPDTNIKFRNDLTPVNTDTLTSIDSSAYFPFTLAVNFGVDEVVPDGKHAKSLDVYGLLPEHYPTGHRYSGYYPVMPNRRKEYTYPLLAFNSTKNHELGHFANLPSAKGVFDLTENSTIDSFNLAYYDTPEGSTYGKYMKFPEEKDFLYGINYTYNLDPNEFYNFLGQIKRWGPKFGFEGTMDISDMTKHRQAMMDTVKHIMNLKPEDIDDIELLRAHNYLNTAKGNYPYNMLDPDKVRLTRMEKYKSMADSVYLARLKELGIGEKLKTTDINEHTYNAINLSLADLGLPIVDSWIPYRQYKVIDDDFANWVNTVEDLSPFIKAHDTESLVDAIYPDFKDRHSKEDLIKYFKIKDNYHSFYDSLKDERRDIQTELMEKDPIFKNMLNLKLHNPLEIIPSMILDQVSDDDLRALVRNRRSSANKGALLRLMYS